MKKSYIEIAVFLFITCFCLLINYFVNELQNKIAVFSSGIALFAGFLTLRTIVINTKNSNKNNFDQQFYFLLERHDHLISKVTDDISNSNILHESYDYDDLKNKLYKHNELSPYFRFLYHFLKFIYYDFYEVNDSDFKKRKKYSSKLRSMINDDVLFLIAANSLNELDDFSIYRKILKDFDFFEHLDIDSERYQAEKCANDIIREYKNFVVNLFRNTTTSYLNKVLFFENDNIEVSNYVPVSFKIESFYFRQHHIRRLDYIKKEISSILKVSEFESNLNDLEIDLVSISLYKQSINVIDISDDIYFLSIDLDRRESRVHSSLGAMNELIDNFINTLTESVTLNDFINLIMTNSIGGCDFYPFAEIMVEFVVLNDLEVKEGKCKSCNINDFIEYLIVCKQLMSLRSLKESDSKKYTIVEKIELEFSSFLNQQKIMNY